MESLFDAEFGAVRIRRSARAKYVRLRVGRDGSLRLTLPMRAALRLARQLLDESRTAIRKARAAQAPAKQWGDGDMVGASHRLVLVADETVAACKTAVRGNQATLRHHPQVDETELQTAIKALVKKVLRTQAKAYLPRRLAALAEIHGLRYDRVRFSSAETRWGSCSSSGTLSLNIGLMALPLELVDYVLIHELCHTRHMNHSADFWQLVEACQSDYKQHRKALKQYSLTV